MWPNELLPGLKVLTVQLLAVLELLYLPLVELTQLVHQLLDLVKHLVPKHSQMDTTYSR